MIFPVVLLYHNHFARPHVRQITQFQFIETQNYQNYTIYYTTFFFLALTWLRPCGDYTFGPHSRSEPETKNEKRKAKNM